MTDTKIACTRPPTGWWCSRPADHGGPCAALPVHEREAELREFAHLVTPPTESAVGRDATAPDRDAAVTPRDAATAADHPELAGLRLPGYLVTVSVAPPELDPDRFAEEFAKAFHRVKEPGRMLSSAFSPAFAQAMQDSQGKDSQPEPPAEPEPPRTLRVVLLAQWRGIRDVRLVIGTGGPSSSHQYAAGVLSVEVKLHDGLGRLGWYPETMEADEIKHRVLCALAVHVATRGSWPVGRPVDTERGEHFNVVEIDLGSVKP